MMKQFPLAVYFTVHESNKEYEEKIIVDSTRVSHGYPAAVVAAVVHHNFLKILLKSDPTTLDKKKLLQNLA